MLLRITALKKMTTVRVAYLLEAHINVLSAQLLSLPKSRIRQFHAYFFWEYRD